MIEPEATQGLNRYSYVLNNPMNATDPTGNFSLRQALGLVVGVVAAVFSFGAAGVLAKFLWAIGGGFASAVISTGSLKAGLWGAISAAAFFGIGQYFSGLANANAVANAARSAAGKAIIKTLSSGLTTGQTIAKIAAHAAAGGTLNVVQGGKFGHGFLSAGFTEALSPAIGQIGDGKDFGTILAKTAVSAAIGGTASDLAGGSFSNGAKTAAFQQLFNHVVTQVSTKPKSQLSAAQRSKLMDDALAKIEESLGKRLYYSTDHAAMVLTNEAADYVDMYGFELGAHFERIAGPGGKVMYRLTEFKRGFNDCYAADSAGCSVKLREGNYAGYIHFHPAHFSANNNQWHSPFSANDYSIIAGIGSSFVSYVYDANSIYGGGLYKIHSKDYGVMYRVYPKEATMIYKAPGGK
jgi:hypothetical protein